MPVLRRAAAKRILDRFVALAVLAIAVSAAGCSADAGDGSDSARKLAAQQDGGCEFTDLNAACAPSADDEGGDDEELNRDELERELDRIEQEITAP